jgi:hypothetical protein
MNAVPSQEAFVVTYSLAVKYIAPQLEAELLRKVPFVSNTKAIGPIIYSAMVYNAHPLLDKVTTVLIPKFTQSAAVSICVTLKSISAKRSLGRIVHDRSEGVLARVQCGHASQECVPVRRR